MKGDLDASRVGDDDLGAPAVVRVGAALRVAASDEAVDDPRGCRGGHPEFTRQLDRTHGGGHQVAQRVQFRDRQTSLAGHLVGHLPGDVDEFLEGDEGR